MDPNSIVCEATELNRLNDIYESKGFVVVRGVVESELLDDFRSELIQLIDARMRSLATPTARHDLDQAYLTLKGLDPAYSRELIIAARETLGFYRVLTSPALLRLVGAVLRCRGLQIVHDCCMMRIDGRDDERQFDWHYDFAYNAMSEYAVTCWIPVTQVDPAMGCMRVVAGSHRTIHPVRLVRELEHTAFAGPRKIALHNVSAQEFERSAVELPAVSPGDVIFLHALTLHRSGANETDRARWIVNPRFSDLYDSKVVARGWNVSRAKNPYVFQDLHPGLVSSS